MDANPEMTARIRSLVVLDPRVTEKPMFGGLCFLLNGHILAAARRNQTVLLQLGAQAAAEAVAEPGVSYMMMRGKPALGFVEVDFGLLETEEELQRWIGRAERFVATRPD